MNRGWQCPCCGGCFSPATPQCFNCTGRYSTASDTHLDASHYLIGISTKPKVPIAHGDSVIRIGEKTFEFTADDRILPRNVNE